FLAYDKGHLDAAQPCVGSTPLVDPHDPAFKQEGHDAVDGKLAFIAPVGEDHYNLPDGYALYLETGLGHVTTSHHVIDFQSTALSMYGTYNVYTSPKTDVEHPANILNCLLRDISVMPHSEADLTATCTVPFDLDMVILSSHAHQFLTKFTM